jgi:hypothetical protein
MSAYKSLKTGKVMSKEGWMHGVEDLFSERSGVPAPKDLWGHVQKVFKLVEVDNDISNTNNS